MVMRAPLANILAVDDEPQILTAIRDLLEDDYIVITATDPLLGLERLGEQQFAVILSDQRMPALGGDEFLARARRVSNASRVLITGYTDIRAAQRAVNNGKIFAYVSKPWDPVGLRKIVDEGVQQHRLIRDLEKSQERKLSLDAARAGVWSWRPLTGEVVWDEAMRGLHGLADGELLGSYDAWTGLIHREDLSAFEGAAKAAVADEGELDVTFRAMKRPDAWRHFRAQAVAVRDEEGRVARVTGLCVDVTDQKEAERQLRHYAEKLEDAQRAQAAHIEEIDRQRRELEKRTAELHATNRELKNFAAVAAHDLKEPLRTIGFHTSLLEEGLGAAIDSEARAHLAAVRNLSRNLSHLIDAILNYMRLGQEEAALVPRSLREVVEGVVSVLELMLKERGIQLRLPENLPVVLCVPDLIGEVFHNLITNGAKYNDKTDKWIEIRVEPSTSEAPNRLVRITVRDNGIGIDPAHSDKVFQMFRRLHGRGEFGSGTGVGLTFVKRIIELHRGRIWFESVPGEGTSFHFTLRLADGEPL